MPKQKVYRPPSFKKPLKKPAAPTHMSRLVVMCARTKHFVRTFHPFNGPHGMLRAISWTTKPAEAAVLGDIEIGQLCDIDEMGIPYRASAEPFLQWRKPRFVRVNVTVPIP
jgi:hypothetical protein